MEEQIAHFVEPLSVFWLFALIAFLLAVIGKGADLLVENAVSLSHRFKIPKAVIGATLVSLGTTLPEVTVSVFAALKGSPELALGNAVGSIICDTGLILGIAILIRPIPLDIDVVKRQGWIQLFAGILLIIACLPWSHLGKVFERGGRMPQAMGFVFLALLVVYLVMSVKWGRQQAELEETVHDHSHEGSAGGIVLKTFLGAFMVVGASVVLIPAVKEIAMRLHIPESIIAATLVAFGTSLPELVTVVTASLKGHGELGLGNVVGADILNVLFVAAAAAAVTPSGLEASKHFFIIFFPAMLFILVLLRVALSVSKQKIGRGFGFLLLLTYIVVTALSYNV
jgi:cation:H+ antiporter